MPSDLGKQAWPLQTCLHTHDFFYSFQYVQSTSYSEAPARKTLLFLTVSPLFALSHPFSRKWPREPSFRVSWGDPIPCTSTRPRLRFRSICASHVHFHDFFSRAKLLPSSISFDWCCAERLIHITTREDARSSSAHHTEALSTRPSQSSSHRSSAASHAHLQRAIYSMLTLSFSLSRTCCMSSVREYETDQSGYRNHVFCEPRPIGVLAAMG